MCGQRHVCIGNGQHDRLVTRRGDEPFRRYVLDEERIEARRATAEDRFRADTPKAAAIVPEDIGETGTAGDSLNGTHPLDEALVDLLEQFAPRNGLSEHHRDHDDNRYGRR